MMSLRNLAFTLVSLLTICNAKAQRTIPEKIRIKLVIEQKLIVSGLSGGSKIDEKKYLKRRWTDKEKVLARSFLSSRLSNLGIDAQEHHYEVSLAHKKASLNPFTGTNLFANIPASIETAEYLILGAHYDTVSESPGAMDNATFGILAYKTETTATDHREFRNAGFNAVGIGGEHKNGDESPHHHLPSDTSNTVDFQYLAFVTFLVYEVMKELVAE